MTAQLIYNSACPALDPADSVGDATRRMLADRVDRIGNTLKALGVTPGQRVLFSVMDGVDFPALFLGIMKIGAVALPINTYLKPSDYEYYINDSAARPRSALVTIPGLGCGQFAGPFRGELGVHLQSALERILLEFGYTLPNIRAVYFDPYDECTDARREIHGISFMVRPLRSPGNAHKPQLCRPETYQDPGDDFSDCSLYSIVAWDPVSWPGNDFFVGSRATDDGVKAAATDSMRAITGVEGRYDRDAAKYLPPAPFRTWGEVVEDGRRRRGLRLWRD